MQEQQARGGQGDSAAVPSGPRIQPPKVAASAAIPIVAVKVAEDR